MNKKKNELSKTLYLILMTTGCMANSFGFIANAIIFGMTVGTIVCGVCAVLMFLLGLFGYSGKYQEKAEFTMIMMIGFFEFPFLYYVYGKSTFVYMILGIVGTVTFLKGKTREITITLEIILDIFIIVFSYLRPCTLELITEENSIGSTVCSYVIVALSVSTMLTLIVRQYRKEHEYLYEMNRKMEAMANLDPLTQLYNRRYLTNYLEPLMEERESSFAVVLMDLDDFKLVNDRYGHVYGDEVLQTFSKCLMNAVGENMSTEEDSLNYEFSNKVPGIAARFGGEEFMLVLKTTKQEQIRGVVEQVQTEFTKFSMESKGVCLTFSGGAEIYHKEDRITQLFNAADEKLYSAKEKGKNQVVF